MKKIAVIGSGISGLTAAHLLSREHNITVYEKNDAIGGHTCTVPVEADGKVWNVDTGFIVFNNRTYPNFIKLMEQIKVPWQPSRMSFSVKCEKTGLEYCLHSPWTTFSQPSNLFSLPFLKMLWEVSRFRKESSKVLENPEDNRTLGDFLETNHYSPMFIDKFIVPMAAAIWSAEARDVKSNFPLSTFLRFFKNHGFLNVLDRPKWQVIKGGSSAYIPYVIKPFEKGIRLNDAVVAVIRGEGFIEVRTAGGHGQRYDDVIIAAHSNEALALLETPTDAERDILGAIPYQANSVVLHTDTSILPRRKGAWASWNYRIPNDDQETVSLTYDMNILQSLAGPREFLVSLNSDDQIDPEKIYRKFVYHHPVYSPAGVAAQKRWSEINRGDGVWFCGAYWGYGFHEDGVKSALRVCEQFRLEL